MTEAIDILRSSLDWLRATYPEHGFFVERDVVWTLQRHLSAGGISQGLTVSNDHAMEPGPRRALSADIVLSGQGLAPEAVLEVKYEPSHRRMSIPRGKLPVVSWAGVLSDIERVSSWTSRHLAGAGIAVLVDEGGYFRSRSSPTGGSWVHWGTYERPDLDVWIHTYESR